MHDPEHGPLDEGIDGVLWIEDVPQVDELRECSRMEDKLDPVLEVIDVRAAVPATVTFKPTVHLNYEETVLPMKDGLPKLRDFPTAIGGSGEMMPE